MSCVARRILISRRLPDDVPVHSYDAKGSCINSILKIATMAVRRRVREAYSKHWILTFLDYAYASCMSNSVYFRTKQPEGTQSGRHFDRREDPTCGFKAEAQHLSKNQATQTEANEQAKYIQAHCLSGPFAS